MMSTPDWERPVRPVVPSSGDFTPVNWLGGVVYFDRKKLAYRVYAQKGDYLDKKFSIKKQAL